MSQRIFACDHNFLLFFIKFSTIPLFTLFLMISLVIEGIELKKQKLQRVIRHLTYFFVDYNKNIRNK